MNLSDPDIETLRSGFRPPRISTLFVGESAPHGGTFFYKADSNLYRQLYKAFGAPDDFLVEFKNQCFYLDDLVLEPVNQIKNLRARNEVRLKAVPSFAQRLIDYQPKAVVALMCAIEPMVRAAMRQAQLFVPFHVVPFPNYKKNRLRFYREMTEIIPQLPSGNCSICGGEHGAEFATNA